ncbi:MAG: translation initiation factor IF-2 [Calditrichia bacterium]
MAEKKNRRKLFKVAKELNLSHQSIQDFLQKKGYEVAGLNTIITDEMHEEILKRFTQEKVQAERIERRRKERQKEVAEVKETEVKETEIAVAEAEEAPSAEAEEPTVPVVEEKPEEVETEEKPVEKIEETEAPKVEAVAEESAPEARAESEEQPLLEETTEPGETEAKAPEAPTAPTEAPPETSVMEPIKEEKPRIGDIIDHPMAKKFLEMQREREAKKRERKKRTLRAIKEGGKKETKEAPVSEAKPTEEEIVPKRIRAIEEKEEKLTAETLPEQIIEEEIRPKRKKEKEKRKEDFDDTLSEKERRRRKALEMIRKESKQVRKKKPLIDITEEETEEEKIDRRKRTRKKKEIDQQEVDDALKKTLASIRDGGLGRKKRKKVKVAEEEVLEEENIIKVTEFITVQDLANLMDVPVSEVITKCLDLGQMVTINQRLEMDLIKLLAEDFGFKVQEEEEFASDFLEDLEAEEDNPEDYVPRHPVVTVMGHVDHGKTSLLDYIRNTNVVGGESGGITQHIGAYVVTTEDGRNITFLDTPGHEAFTAMRSRGAQVTDLVVLVIAADDRVMPQTEEALDHARAAGVPIVIAINKIDKENANPQAIRKQLAERNVLVEDWGGKYQVVEVSAKTGQGIDELLEKILLEAELLELKANPKRRAYGVVIESRLDKGKGPVATVLIQQGTLHVGDHFIMGQYYGRVRALLNEKNQRLTEVGPGYPVQILGIEGVPEAGDKMICLPDERHAREIALHRQQLKREQDFRQIRLLTLDEISRQIKEGQIKELNILVKADVDGSAQALTDSLLKLSNNDVAVKVIRRAVGPITESDVMLASASNAIIIGFHVRPTLKAKSLAETENVDIRLYKVIYDAIEDVKLALEGLLEPEEREIVLGLAEVREVFRISRVGTIAGCYMLDGKIHRNAHVRLIRNDVEVYTGRIASLKRFKDDVKEVSAGYECGIMIENYNDIKVGDQIEAFEVVKEKRTLSSK